MCIVRFLFSCVAGTLLCSALDMDNVAVEIFQQRDFLKKPGLNLLK